ncbi:phage shock envelope stress response protein PspM [Haloechinothrix halophila]|uniref:phage shock envelope stress response protein PspM n=1 Tax=Haloechinothrix halophila TaxID=1069073 RepID=UPI0003FF7160|nr:hypothetical protein [Haloechinothrix halophila]
MIDKSRWPVQFPFVADLAKQWEEWNEPSAKLARRKERASRGLTIWLVLATLCGIAVGTGSHPFITGLVVFTALAVRAGLRLRRLHRATAPLSDGKRRALPPRTSVAHEPMQRLVEARKSLRELLDQLATPHAGGPAVADDSLNAARSTATEAEEALYGLAARIVAIERARDAAPAGERRSLDSAVTTLREQLADGVDSYGSLLAAAGKAVAARGGGLGGARESLTDATDRLAGMAMALRELST